MFAGLNWLCLGLGFVAAFVLGWFYNLPKGRYPLWSARAGIRHERGDPMAASFGSLVVGLVLYAVFVGVMTARGQVGPLVLAIPAFRGMGRSNNAFKKLGAARCTVDAASWARSGVVMILAQWRVGGA